MLLFFYWCCCYERAVMELHGATPLADKHTHGRVVTHRPQARALHEPLRKAKRAIMCETHTLGRGALPEDMTIGLSIAGQGRAMKKC